MSPLTVLGHVLDAASLAAACWVCYRFGREWDEYRDYFRGLSRRLTRGRSTRAHQRIREGILSARLAIDLSQHVTRGHTTIGVSGGHFERAVRHTLLRHALRGGAYHPDGTPKVRIILARY